MPPENTPDPVKELSDAKAEADAAKAEAATLKAEIEALKKAATPPKTDDKDLNEKARLEREAKSKTGQDSKALEDAIRFSLESDKFLKTNEALLPKEVAEIFTLAGKEKYENPIEKDQAIKAGIVQSFFSVQANADLLTASQKSKLDDYLKLTKTGKQEKAQQFYESIFEPAFEMLKRLKKAEALSKGHGGDGDAEKAYAKRLQDLSRKHYLGEKVNA